MTNTVRVLLVEDNPGDVGLIRAALDESPVAGFEVDSVSSVGSCRSSLDSGEYDVLLLDYSLPGENGLISAPRKRQETAPPSSCSPASGDEFIAKEAIRSGAPDYYAKGSITRHPQPRDYGRLGKACPAAEEQRQREELDNERLRTRSRSAQPGLPDRRPERECRAPSATAADLLLMLDLDGFKECNDKDTLTAIPSSQVAAISHPSATSISPPVAAPRFGVPQTGLNGACRLPNGCAWSSRNDHRRPSLVTITASIAFSRREPAPPGDAAECQRRRAQAKSRQRPRLRVQRPHLARDRQSRANRRYLQVPRPPGMTSFVLTILAPLCSPSRDCQHRHFSYPCCRDRTDEKVQRDRRRDERKEIIRAVLEAEIDRAFVLISLNPDRWAITKTTEAEINGRHLKTVTRSVLP
jgi:CheY-like chemotaxis protein